MPATFQYSFSSNGSMERKVPYKEKTIVGKEAAVEKKGSIKGCEEARDEPRERSDDTQQVPAQQTGASSRFQDLPEDFKDLKGFIFKDEEELDQELERLGISDLPILLGEDGKAYFNMPGNEHNRLTGHIAKHYNLWSHDKKGLARENTNVPLDTRSASAPAPRKRQKHTKRLPDVSIWGPSRCETDSFGDLLARRANPPSNYPEVHPSVIIQVSMFNDEDYEIDAIDDLVNRATSVQGPPPNLGVLIKIREADPDRGISAGFDVYEIPHGSYFRDAVNQTGGARHTSYNHGGPDIIVTITEAQLDGFGPMGIWDRLKNYLQGGNESFQISMERLYAMVIRF